MFKLMVSYDCGMSYVCEDEAETPEELLPKAKDFGEQGLRWVIENESGKIENISSIHRNILDHIARINHK